MTARKPRLQLGQAVLDAAHAASSGTDHDAPEAPAPEKDAAPPTDTPPAQEHGRQAAGAEGGTAPARDPVVRIWQSGDWLRTPRKTAPYNGLQITGSYGGSVKPGAVDVTLTDFTNDRDGVSGKIEGLTAADGWTPIPHLATPMGVEAEGSGFTVKGALCIATFVNGRFLRVRLSYGPPSLQREQVGLIFSVD